MTSSLTDPDPGQWFARIASALDRRSAPRLILLLLGALLARGRRTVTSGIRAAGLSDQFRPCYTTVAAAGKRSDRAAARLATAAGRPGCHADPAVRPARRGSRHPSHPDSRPGRCAVSLRPCLRGPRAAGDAPELGRPRAAPAGPAVRPPEGPAPDRSQAPPGVP